MKRRHLAWTLSIAAHLMVFAALFWPYPASPPRDTPSPPIMVSVVEQPTPPGPPDESKTAGGAPQIAVQPAPPRHAAPVPVLASVRATSPDTADMAPDNSDLLSESQLAGAANAGEGAGGGGSGCDTARAVQQALRRDPLVRIAVEDAHRLGKAIMLWNGDWVRSGDQDGKGLSAVREAITWEVAFSPAACRNQRVHGLVLLSLADGNTRFAIGSGDWRWSDLLGADR